MTVSLREDEVSFQYGHPSDGAFWIRVSKPVTETLTISDLCQGRLPDDEMAGALAGVLDAHATPGVRRLVFDDIVPEAPGQATEKSMVAARFDRISRFVTAWVEQSARRLENAYLDNRLGRFSAIFELG